jgi:antitoxin component of MazEF toxin-antitoxin module
VQTKIERIGEGFGVLLPKDLLDACGFGSEATITVQDNALILTPVPRAPRDGWAEALSAIPQAVLERDFKELEAFREAPHEWGDTEWRWPEDPSDEKV